MFCVVFARATEAERAYLLPFLKGVLHCTLDKAADGEAQLTDARTESFLANLLALEGEIRDAIRKPLGCRSDVAVF